MENLFELAVSLARQEFTDDRETMGELAGAVTRLEVALAELRDDHTDLARKLHAIQSRRLFTDIDAA